MQTYPVLNHILEEEKLAKVGAIQTPYNKFSAVFLSVGKKLKKKQLELKHQNRWTVCSG
jgi:hypothetical protein